MKMIRKLTAFISTLIVLIIATIFYARFIEPNLIIAKTISASKGIMKEPMKLVFFSDTHFGRLYSEDNVEKLVSKINEQNPDIVVFGGDFFDAYDKDQEILDIEYLMEQLKDIHANYAKIAVWGNHDKGGGSARVYPRLMEEAGFKLLKNETLYLEEVNVAIRGLDDYLLGNPNTSTEMLKGEQFNIVVSHAPDIIDEMEGSNVDFVVAGHSHGGQVFVPGLTEKMLPMGAKKYSKGLYQFKNERDSKMYVSKGLGLTQIPYRFLNMPEIVVVSFE